MSLDQIPSSSSSSYLLGHADAEVRRLLLQARLYDGYTEHALRQAGLRPGMRVLDVGCGPGDVSFVAARLVGPEGTVLGIDAAADILELARSRAAEHGFTSVRFEQTTVGDLALDEPVDAVIGRLILMHLPDPVGTLAQLAGLVRPGGFIAFSEFDMTAAGSVPDLPAWLAAREGITRTFTGLGLDPAFGATLPRLFRQAGLGSPRLILGAPIGGVGDEGPVEFVVETWRSLLPAAEQLGLVTDDVADLDTLQRRLTEEVAAAEAVVTMPALISASCQV